VTDRKLPFEVRDLPPPSNPAPPRRLVPVDPPGPPALLSPGDRMRAQGAQGAPLPTGFKTLDQSTRGGPRKGNLVVLGGAPGAGKTTLGVNLVRGYLEGGLFVGVLASDEEPFGLLARLGQSLGFSREDLEGPDETARAECAACFDEKYPRLLVADAHDGHSVESASEALLAAAAGAPAVLFVDSIQTVRALGTEDAESPRQRVDAAVTALKLAARRGLLVFATCELNRGAYRTSDPSARVADLAAFKESGGIEYGASIALLLRSVKDEPDLVDAAFAKNRLRGPDAADEFRLRLDRRHAVFAEVGKPDEPDREDLRESSARVALARLRARIVDTVRRNPSLTSRNAIARATGPGRREATLDAIAGLVEDGTLVELDGGWRVRESERE
jgi:hypothetical protein